MATKYSQQYRKRHKTMKAKGQRPCFFYMDKSTYDQIKKNVPRGQMTAFFRTALEIAVSPLFLERMKRDMVNHTRIRKAA